MKNKRMNQKSLLINYFNGKKKDILKQLKIIKLHKKHSKYGKVLKIRLMIKY